MGVNKVIINTPEGERVIVDMTGTSVVPEKLFAGEIALDKTGEMIEGSFSIDTELSQQDALIAQIQAALEGKAAGGGGEKDRWVKLSDGVATYAKDPTLTYTAEIPEDTGTIVIFTGSTPTAFITKQGSTWYGAYWSFYEVYEDSGATYLALGDCQMYTTYFLYFIPLGEAHSA